MIIEFERKDFELSILRIIIIILQGHIELHVEQVVVVLPMNLRANFTIKIGIQFKNDRGFYFYSNISMELIVIQVLKLTTCNSTSPPHYQELNTFIKSLLAQI